jgi:hypothetical protein
MMEKKPNEIANSQSIDFTEKRMTRKEALKKTGLIAVSATTMMVLLGNKSHAMVDPKDDFNPGNGGPRTSPGHP